MTIVPAAPVAEHLRHVADATGVGRAQLAREAGVDRSTIWMILTGRQQTVCRGTADKLLALPLTLTPTVAHQRMTPTLGSARRLRALYALAHPAETIAAECDVSLQTVVDIVGGTQQRVRWEIHHRIKAAYARLSSEVGSAYRTRARAEREGWAAPSAWIGQDLDDPASRPLPLTDPALGATSLLRALYAAGHPMHRLAVESGLPYREIHALITGTCTEITAEVDRRIRLLHTRLADRPGPSQRTRAWARRRGWAPPVARRAEESGRPAWGVYEHRRQQAIYRLMQHTTLSPGEIGKHVDGRSAAAVLRVWEQAQREARKAGLPPLTRRRLAHRAADPTSPTPAPATR